MEIAAGDIAFYPERVPRAVRNARTNDRGFVLVTAISPPEFDLSAASNDYDATFASTTASSSSSSGSRSRTKPPTSAAREKGSS